MNIENTKKIQALMKACDCLPSNIKGIISHIPEEKQVICEEIRIRANQPIYAVWNNKENKISNQITTSSMLQDILSKASRYSVHSYTEYICQGFLPLDGGHRLGICGEAVVKNNCIVGIRSISSLNIRIAHQYLGAADSIISQIFFKNGRIKNVLIISPPAYGKTTLLRDLIRQISNKGVRIAVADERGEICALNQGTPQFDVGMHTDIMQAPKSQAVLTLLKTMSPQIIALDEVTSPLDIDAIKYAGNCGVYVFASAHAFDIDDLKNRPLYKEMLDLCIFDIVINIKRQENIRIFDVFQI